MNEPRYEFWRPIQPVEGQPIPDGAAYKIIGCDWEANSSKHCPVFDRSDRRFEWRVPVEVVPMDLAADAIMQGFQFSEEMRRAGLPHLSVSFAGGLSAKTQEQLRELVIAKLRELSQEKT